MSNEDFSFCRAFNKGLGHTMQDFAGRQGMMSTFGETVVGSHIDDVSCQFQYNNSPNDVNVSFSGTGFNSNADSMARVGVTAGGVGLSQMSSVDSIRYRPGHEAFAHQTGLFVGAGVGVSHFLGIGNGADRIGWGTEDGVPGIHFWEGGNKTFIPWDDFARDPIGGNNPNLPSESGFTWDPEKMNLFMPSFGWLGIAPIIFGIHGGYARGWLAPHFLDFTNTLIEPHLQNPSLPLLAEVERTSGDGEAYLDTSSWRAGVVAGRSEDNASNRRFGFVRLEVAPGTSPALSEVVMSVQSKDLFQTKTNHVTTNFDTFIGSNNHNKDILFEVWPTEQLMALNAGFTPVWVDNSTDNSVLQSDVTTGATVTTVGADRLELGLVKANSQRPNQDVKGAKLYPGQSITITARSLAGGAGTLSLQIEGFELF